MYSYKFSSKYSSIIIIIFGKKYSFNMESLNNIPVSRFSFSYKKRNASMMSGQGLQHPQCVPCSAIRIKREEASQLITHNKRSSHTQHHHLPESTVAVCFLLQSPL